MTFIDHIIAGFLALACLAQLFVRFDPEDHSRFALYSAAAASALFFAAGPLAAWWFAGRPLRAFGLHDWIGPRPLILLCALLWLMLLALGYELLRRGLLREPLAAIYRRFAWIIPRSRRELGASWATSVAAGAGEEIAFRGFLLWYGAGFFGPLPGLLASSLLFGAAHSYQSRLGIVFATLAGFLLGGVYLTTGSLLLAIWMHATWNMASFAAGRTLLASTGGSPPGSL